MRRNVMMAVIMVGMAVLLIGGSLMATHNDSLTIPLFAAGEVVPTGGLSIDGTNTLALPYIPDGRVDDAHKLGLDIGGFDLLTGGPVLNIQRLLRNGNVLEPYNGSLRGNNFGLIGGVGYRVRVKNHVDYAAVGSHDEFAHLAAGVKSPPAAALEDDEALAEWCKRVAGSGFHPSCTAKMAPADDPLGVVDQRLRLRGYDNLYVADASVMPKCPRANIHLTSIMIAERAGEWLREGVV